MQLLTEIACQTSTIEYAVACSHETGMDNSACDVVGLSSMTKSALNIQKLTFGITTQRTINALRCQEPLGNMFAKTNIALIADR